MLATSRDQLSTREGGRLGEVVADLAADEDDAAIERASLPVGPLTSTTTSGASPPTQPMTPKRT